MKTYEKHAIDSGRGGHYTIRRAVSRDDGMWDLYSGVAHNGVQYLQHDIWRAPLPESEAKAWVDRIYE